MEEATSQGGVTTEISPRTARGSRATPGPIHIIANPQQMGGAPCIRGLRIPVATLVGMVADGMKVAEILKAYPDLVEADISEALQYAAEALRERELP
jgi:uncharacterized protein (DUF433 family)